MNSPTFYPPWLAWILYLIVLAIQGRWVTVFKAQWSPNPDVYPHFTVRFHVMPSAEFLFTSFHYDFNLIIPDRKHESLFGYFQRKSESFDGSVDLYVQFLTITFAGRSSCSIIRPSQVRTILNLTPAKDLLFTRSSG